MYYLNVLRILSSQHNSNFIFFSCLELYFTRIEQNHRGYPLLAMTRTILTSGRILTEVKCWIKPLKIRVWKVGRWFTWKWLNDCYSLWQKFVIWTVRGGVRLFGYNLHITGSSHDWSFHLILVCYSFSGSLLPTLVSHFIGRSSTKYIFYPIT